MDCARNTKRVGKYVQKRERERAGTRTIGSKGLEVSIRRKAWVWVARGLHIETRGYRRVV
jgi:hypothetical protein